MSAKTWWRGEVGRRGVGTMKWSQSGQEEAVKYSHFVANDRGDGGVGVGGGLVAMVTGWQ